MIYESRYWKDPLLHAADWLESLVLSGDKSDHVRVERELFLGFYGIRKLLDTFKISDSTRQLTLTLASYRCHKKVDYLNSHRIEELYDLANTMAETRDLTYVCNQFVHSFVFTVLSDENARFSGCFVASDKMRNKKLYSVSLNNILLAFRTVGKDYPSKFIMHRDPETDDWKGLVT